MDNTTMFIRSYANPTLAQDDQWITVKPNGPNKTGRPALIGTGGEIKAGMGGKFNGTKIKDLKKNSEKQKSQNNSSPNKLASTGKLDKSNKSPTSHEPNGNTSFGESGISKTQEPRVLTNAEQKQYLQAARIDQSKLSKQEKTAIEHFEGLSWGPLGTELRSGKLSKESKKEVEILDRAFSKSATTEDIMVYRGIGGGFMDKLKVGDSFTDNSYAFTSTDRKIAAGFSTNENRERAVMQFVVPRGSRAMTMDMDRAKSMNLNEIILDRGGNFTVTKIIPGTRTRPKTFIVSFKEK